MPSSSMILSPSKKNQIATNIEDEKQFINEKRVDLIKELELETRKRNESEDNFEKLREEFIKFEL